MNLFKRCGCRESCDHPWWYRFRFQGREHKRSTKTTNRTLAQRIAAKRQVEILEGRERLRGPKAPCLSAHIESYVAWTAKHNRTSNKDPGVLAGFLTVVGDKRLDQVGPFDIERWKTARAKEVKLATVNRELNIIRGCFSRAVEWKLIDSSPVVSVKPYRVRNVRCRVLSAEEITTLLTKAPPDLALLGRATLEGLFRLSEILNLRVEDIREDHITLTYTKNDRLRKVPITPALRRDLLTRAHASGYVFGVDPTGAPPKDTTVSVTFRRAAKRLGLIDVSHHTLRHTGTTVMLAAGASLRAVQEIGGWTSLRMLERYAHPSDGEKRKAVEIAASLTKVGTKTGTAKRVAHISEGLRAQKLLKLWQCPSREKGDTSFWRHG